MAAFQVITYGRIWVFTEAETPTHTSSTDQVVHTDKYIQACGLFILTGSDSRKTARPERNLYLWLTYRTFGLTRPLRLTWRQLYEQFGADPAKASKVARQAFRRDCLRELQKIQRAWPDLHYRTVKGALVLSPSPPRIPPSQLRLVE